MHLHHKLTLDMDESLANPTNYRVLVDALVYLTISGPDITLVVHIAKQFISPSQQLTMWLFFAFLDIYVAL